MYNNNQKRKTWLWVLGWIFIFPVPLTLIILKKEQLDKKTKYGIIAGAWILYIIILIIGASINKDSSTIPSADNQNSSVIQTEKPTKARVYESTTSSTQSAEDEPTNPPTEKPTEKPIETIAENSQENDSSIEIDEYTYKVETGSNAYVRIIGKPNTKYSIYVYYGSGISEAEGLEDKISDNNGSVTWEWKVGSRTTPGNYKITITGGGASEDIMFSVYN